MVVRANIVKNQAISVDLNQKVGGFNAPVKSVNSKTGDVILDADDVGAISKDELQATTNEILAQAKESGEFDGPQGPQGEKGEKGDKGDIGLTGPQGPAGNDANVTAENIDRALGYTPADHIALEELTRRLNALADSDDVTLDQVSELVAYIKDNRELIESVTTNKVNVSDIIDNLTTNVSNKPLSAAQGAVLKGLINDLESSKANQTGLDELSDWTHQAVDEIVEFVSKDSNIESAFNFVSSNTLNWNGDTTGKLISVNSKDSSMSYVRVSSVVPTLTELQKGGTWATTGDDGVEYEEPFTIDNIVENGNLIVGVDGYFLVAKEDNVQYIEGTDINVVLPKAGTYFIYFGDDGYMSRLSVTDYTGFTKPILKMESLTLHQHDWYGKAVVGGNTVRGDETVHGGFVKVSDSVPTLEEVNKGGTVRYYYVTDNKITGDLIVGNYLESPYSAFSSGNEIIIASDGVVIVKINSSGVFFKQSNDVCVHSLTINGYTKFSYNVEKIPFELIPEGIGGGVTSWNDLDDKPFEETIITSDTFIWNGDITDRYIVDVGGVPVVHITDIAPTYDELLNGCKYYITEPNHYGINVENITNIENENIANVGNLIVFTPFISVLEDNVELEGTVFEKKGIYIMLENNNFISLKLKINGFTRFNNIVLTTKYEYIPITEYRIYRDISVSGCILDKSFNEIVAAYNKGLTCKLYDGSLIYSLVIITSNKLVFTVTVYTSTDTGHIYTITIDSDNNTNALIYDI